MSLYYDARNYCIRVKCDACGENVVCYERQSDIGLGHMWMKDNGWKNRKVGDKWRAFCPTCEEERKRVNRERYFKREAGQ